MCKGPRLQYRTLLPASPDLRLDVLQVFESNPTLRAFGSLDKSFGDDVVRVGRKAAFLSRQDTQAAPRPVRALALQPGAQPAMPVAHTLQFLPAVEGTVAVDCDVGDAQVNPERAFHIEWFRLLDVADREEIERAANEDEIGFTLAGPARGASRRRQATPPSPRQTFRRECF